MGRDRHKTRLDEILVKQGVVSEEDIREALKCQQTHGGKFGSHLLACGRIDEAGLVKALATQLGCEGVVLSGVDIPEPVLSLVPGKVVIARKVVPFDYDPVGNRVKIACEDPTDENLVNELSFIARGKEIKLYVAAELALDSVISRYYLGRNVPPDDNVRTEVRYEESGSDDRSSGTLEITEPATPGSPRRVLLVTDEEQVGPLLESLFERDGYQVVVTDSADDAIELLADDEFHSVLIKDTIPGDYIDLIDRMRKSSPRTLVRYYESTSALLLGENSSRVEGGLAIKSLDLLTSLLSSKCGVIANHSGRVGKYVHKLCRRIGLPHKEVLMITTAGYLHDLAAFYYQTEPTQDARKTITLTVKLLQSLGFPPVLVEMLRSMYLDLKGKYTKRLPVEVLGGNILTIVDLFCDHVPVNVRLSLDTFDAISKKLRGLSGILLLEEVVEVFVDMVQEEVLEVPTGVHCRQVMILADGGERLELLNLRLRSEGFRTVAEQTLHGFADLYQRRQPDVIVLMPAGPASDVSNSVVQLAARGVDFQAAPTFILVENSYASQLTNLLDRGIEDIVALEDNFDMLLAKLQKLRARIENGTGDGDRRHGSHGSRGRLADMNLIDLLQALGPSRKTAKLTLRCQATEDKPLVIYLHGGVIHHAACGDAAGPQAVYAGVGWTDGTWTVEPVSEDDLPAANNQLPNESILMEGCRLFDEKVRTGQPT